MHERPMKESDGVLSGALPTVGIHCGRCGLSNVLVQQWHSNDGGYVDEKFTCGGCQYVWWVDGIDS